MKKHPTNFREWADLNSEPKETWRSVIEELGFWVLMIILVVTVVMGRPPTDAEQEACLRVKILDSLEALDSLYIRHDPDESYDHAHQLMMLEMWKAGWRPE